MLPEESSLESRDAGDLAAHVDRVARDQLGLCSDDHASAVRSQCGDAGDVFHQPHGAVGQFRRARAKHVGVRVAGDGLPAVAVPDHLQGPQHGAGVIPVTVRKYERLHRSKIHAETRHVLLEGPVLRTRIEQDGVVRAVFPDGDKARQTVCRAAQAAAGENPCAAPAPPEGGKLGFDERRHRRQVVGHVVDQYLHLDAADRLERVHGTRSLVMAGVLRRQVARLHRARGVGQRDRVITLDGDPTANIAAISDTSVVASSLGHTESLAVRGETVFAA